MLKNIYISYNLAKLLLITTIFIGALFYVFQFRPAHAAVTNTPSDIFGITVSPEMSTCSIVNFNIDIQLKVSITKNKLKNQSLDSLSFGNDTRYHSYIGLNAYSEYNDNFSYFLKKSDFQDDGQGHFVATMTVPNKTKGRYYNFYAAIIGYDASNQYRTQYQTIDNIVFFRCFQDIGLNIEPKNLVDYFYFSPTYYANYDFNLSVDRTKVEVGEDIYVSVTLESGGSSFGYWLSSSNNYSLTIPSTGFGPFYRYTSYTRGAQIKNLSAIIYSIRKNNSNLPDAWLPSTRISNSNLTVNFKDKPNISSVSAESLCDSGKNTFTNKITWTGKESTSFLIYRKEDVPSDLYTYIRTVVPGDAQLNNLGQYSNYTYYDADSVLENNKKYIYKIIAQDGNSAFAFPSTLQAISASCAPQIRFTDYIQNITEQIDSAHSRDGLELLFRPDNKRYEKLAIWRKSSTMDYQEIKSYNKGENPTCKYFLGNGTCNVYSYKDFGTDTNPLSSGTTYTYKIGANYFDNSGIEKWAWSEELSQQLVGQAPVINSFNVTPGCWTDDPNSYVDSTKRVVRGNQLDFTWNLANAYAVSIYGKRPDENTYRPLWDLGLVGKENGFTGQFAYGVAGYGGYVNVNSFYIVVTGSKGANTSSIVTLDPSRVKNCLSDRPAVFTALPKCDGTNSQIDIQYSTYSDSNYYEPATGLIVTSNQGDKQSYSANNSYNTVAQTMSISNSEGNRIYYFYPWIVNKNGIINFTATDTQQLLTMNCAGSVPAGKSEIKGNVFSGKKQDGGNGINITNPNITILPDSVFSTSSGIIEIGSSGAQKLSNYNTLNIAKWSLATTKASQAVNKLKTEQATTLPGPAIAGYFTLNNDTNKYPNGRIWYWKGDITLTNVNFIGKGTIIADGSVTINGYTMNGSGGCGNDSGNGENSLGIIANGGDANGGDIIINPPTDSACIQGFYYATGEIKIN